MKKHTLKAGYYAIGDPSYFISEWGWDKLLDDTFSFGMVKADGKVPDISPEAWDDGLYHYKDLDCFAHHTAFGDGEYYCPLLKELVFVDSGILGIMPIQACDMFPENSEGYIIHKFATDFDVWEKDGIFHFGIYDINTN